jgi:hypothetical protein
MKMILRIIGVAVLLWGCAGPGTIVQNKQYDTKNLTEKRMLILPFTDNMMSIQKDAYEDFEDDTESDTVELKLGDIESAYKLYFHKILMSVRDVKLLNTESVKIPFTNQKDTASFFMITKKIGVDSARYKFYIPKRNALTEKNIETDIVVIINKLTFSKGSYGSAGSYSPGYAYTTPGGTFSTPGHWSSGGSITNLVASFDFIIYDYDQKVAVTYGTSKISSALDDMNIGTNKDCFEKIAIEIFRYTPFTWTERSLYKGSNW